MYVHSIPYIAESYLISFWSVCPFQAEYDDGQMQPRLPIFKNFRQYENLHMLIWIGKDLAWITLNITMWFICFVPAILIAADFVYLSVTSIGEVGGNPSGHVGYLDLDCYRFPISGQHSSDCPFRSGANLGYRQLRVGAGRSLRGRLRRPHDDVG